MKKGRLRSAFMRFAKSGGLNVVAGLAMMGGGVAGAFTGHPADAGLIAIGGSQFAIANLVRSQYKSSTP